MPKWSNLDDLNFEHQMRSKDRSYKSPPRTGPMIIPQVNEADRNAMYCPLFSGLAVSATIAKLRTPTMAPDKPWKTRAITMTAGDWPKSKKEVDIAIAM
jgi:hypothetical protein